MVLLGITWVFGAMGVGGDAKIVFAYVFCIANSLQGFLIFVVRCLHYPEARAAWWQLLTTRTFKKRRGRDVISSQSHSGGATGGGYKSKSTSANFSANTNNSNNIGSGRGGRGGGKRADVRRPILAENGMLTRGEIPFIDNEDDEVTYRERM
ncbi:PREDICTED: latrophilin-3-like [Priapulus caudatus]|uniref:Latrophilin-3-like n=1 Tax=Priapulus caudatus TaxID=37621 RepID=A0ABM1F6U7_PRICU|nr:PREDICTED: latrophilin-3-like [Priapulus caudatus]